MWRRVRSSIVSHGSVCVCVPTRFARALSLLWRQRGCLEDFWKGNGEKGISVR
jgi:hypothetical protein